MISLVNILTCFFEAIISMMLINAYTEKSADISPAKHIISVAILGILFNICNYFAGYNFVNIILMGISFAIVAFFYNGKIKNTLIFLNGGVWLKLCVCLLSQLILSGVAYFTILISCYIMQYSPLDIISVFNGKRIIAVLISKTIHIILVKLALKTKYTNPINARNGIALCLIPTTSILALSFLMKVILMNEKISLYMIVGIFGLILANIVTYYFFTIMNKDYEHKLKSKLLEQQNENLERSIADDKAFVKKMKTLRHDINNHSVAIQALFEKGDCAAGIEYMKNIVSQITLSDDIIETGNVALDAIINTKKTVAQSKGIEFTTNIQIPERVFVADIDLCTIFGNALDNCIEGCERVKDKNKKISVSIVYDDNSLICKIVNTSAKSHGKFLHTIKKDKDNHGFGISNIETALSKYKTEYCQHSR